jgi:hypothetical protein
MYLPEFELKKCSNHISNENAYTLGWFAGDGFVDKNNPIVLVQQNEYCDVLILVLFSF